MISLSMFIWAYWCITTYITIKIMPLNANSKDIVETWKIEICSITLYFISSVNWISSFAFYPRLYSNILTKKYETIHVFDMEPYNYHVKICMSNVGLSHGSKFNNWWVWAMAQRPIIWGFEPWLKVQYLMSLSHGSKSYFLGVWAMAQSLIF